MTVQEMWNQFVSTRNIGDEYTAWAFGDDPDVLAWLVLSGKKTATASAWPLYELEGEELPKAGEYSVVLNSRQEPVCIIQTTKVFLTPFDCVDDEQARKEGEGDLSLSYWRQVHERFFRQEMEQAGLVFSGEMLVVCEEFLCVYP